MCCKTRVPSSVRQWHGWLKNPQQKLAACLEGKSMSVCSRECSKHCLFAPKFAYICFLCAWTGMAYHWYFTVLVFQVFIWNFTIFTGLQVILASVNSKHHFICSILLDIEILNLEMSNNHYHCYKVRTQPPCTLTVNFHWKLLLF